MNEVQIKELVDQGFKSAFLIGTMTGSLSTLLNNIQTGVLNDKEAIYKELVDLHRQAGMQVHELYYKHLDGGK